MKLGKKILIICLAVLLIAVGEYVLYYVFHYVNFKDYKDTLSSYTVEAGSDYSPKEKGAKGDYDLIAENDKLEFYADPSTGDIAVYDLADDTWYYSTPLDIDEDKVANADNKERLKSQLIINFFNQNRNEGIYTSRGEVIDVDPSQLKAENIENGIRFIYHFKQKAASSEVIPYVISRERYENFTSQMSEKTQKDMKQFYNLNEEEDRYEIINSLSTGKGQARNYDKIYKALYNEAGYTDEDYAIDMADTEFTVNTRASFYVTLEYRLEEDGLRVNVPTGEIKEINGSIHSIEVLPGFGYATKEDTGYFVVPNGSGSLINFNNAKNSRYSAYIYGIDPTLANYTKVENADTVKLPIFGVCYDDHSLLAAVEDGKSLGQINAYTAGGTEALSSYNTSSYTFYLRGSETLGMFGTTGNAANLPIVEKTFADVNIQIRYSFLGKDNTGYSGIANYYRNVLEKRGDIKPNGDPLSTEVSDIGFYYDVIGGVKVTDFFMGVKYLGVKAMTTYEQAKEMATYLAGKGIRNQVVNFQGWFNGGYYHDVADKVKMIKKLGSEKKLDELTSYIEGIGGRIYADVAFQKVTDISKRYNQTYEAAKYYAGYSLLLGQVNPVTLRQTASLGYMETLYSIVSPKFLVRYVDKFISKTEDMKVTGFSLRDLGSVLSSDKKRTEIINREMALDVVEAQLKRFADNGDKKVMVSAANEYAAKYADDIINAPIAQNSYYSVDAEIPLYEMIYHGYVDYAGYNINTSDTYDVDDISLKLIEFGCSPHFVFTYLESNNMKYTGVNDVYASTFDTWKDTAVKIYEKVNDALKNVRYAVIVAHERLDEGVSKVSYSNGVTIYVNTTASSYSDDEISIEAKSYAVKGVN